MERFSAMLNMFMCDALNLAECRLNKEWSMIYGSFILTAVNVSKVYLKLGTDCEAVLVMQLKQLPSWPLYLG